MSFHNYFHFTITGQRILPWTFPVWKTSQKIQSTTYSKQLVTAVARLLPDIPHFTTNVHHEASKKCTTIWRTVHDLFSVTFTYFFRSKSTRELFPFYHHYIDDLVSLMKFIQSYQHVQAILSSTTVTHLTLIVTYCLPVGKHIAATLT